MESLASILLSVFAIAMIIAFAKSGMGGIGTWLHAKFVGEG
jgi:hypothetical protein